ncbi:MAG TPA: hypothetical protein VK604_25255 [Bryobacteraceae bacterium]|nr:hypothetical protein [Bryobacteraceae bacterium]
MRDSFRLLLALFGDLLLQKITDQIGRLFVIAAHDMGIGVQRDRCVRVP